MIKYSQRGLVTRGEVSPLFQYLYHTLILTFSVIFCVVGFSGYFGKEDPKSQQIMMQICLNNFKDINTSPNSKKVLIIGVTISSVTNATLILAYVASKLYILRISKNDQTPIKFGRYRRNVLTYTQTMVLGFMTCVFFIIDLSFASSFNEKIFALFRNLISWNHLLNLTFFNGVLAPLYILWDLYESKPDFFISYREDKTKNDIFYITSPQIAPRRESVFKIVASHRADNISHPIVTNSGDKMEIPRFNIHVINHGVTERVQSNNHVTIEVHVESDNTVSREDRRLCDAKFQLNTPEKGLPDVD